MQWCQVGSGRQNAGKCVGAVLSHNLSFIIIADTVSSVSAFRLPDNIRHHYT